MHFKGWLKILTCVSCEDLGIFQYKHGLREQSGAFVLERVLSGF